jgi:hypothetical protein
VRRCKNGYGQGKTGQSDAKRLDLHALSSLRFLHLPVMGFAILRVLSLI